MPMRVVPDVVSGSTMVTLELLWFLWATCVAFCGMANAIAGDECSTHPEIVRHGQCHGLVAFTDLCAITGSMFIVLVLGCEHSMWLINAVTSGMALSTAVIGIITLESWVRLAAHRVPVWIGFKFVPSALLMPCFVSVLWTLAMAVLVGRATIVWCLARNAQPITQQQHSLEEDVGV